jgi:feruloyl-CoA synthase
VFAAPDVEASCEDGTWLLRSRIPLGTIEPSVGAVLRRRAAATPDVDLLCERAPDGSWRRVTYAGALALARSVGQGLLDRGLGPDRPVAILSGNGVDHGLLMLACYVAGVPVVPVSVAYSLQSTDHRKLRHIVDTVQPGLVFTTDRTAFAGAIAAIGTVDVADTLAGIAAEPATVDDVVIEHDTVAKILFTSGSTGVPKGVVNTHGMLCANQEQARAVWPFTRTEALVLVDWLPWSHTFGGNHNFNAVLWSGGTLHVDGGRPVPGQIDTTVANLRDVAPTAYFNVPAGYAALLPHLEEDAELVDRLRSRLRFAMYAAAALPADVWDRWVTVLGPDIPLTTAWGSTETAPLATTSHFPMAGPGCIGVPVPGVELKLVPSGRKLELRVKGPNVMPGYLGEPELSAAAFDDEGFYAMGDAGRFLDPDEPARGIVFDGRIAEDFKLMTGTWVSVGNLRTQLVNQGGGAIQDVVIAGQDRDELGTLVWLSSSGDIDALRTAIEKHNADHPESSARIGRAVVLAEPPSIDGGEITDKGYINQRATLDRRADDVARLYAEPDLTFD